MDLERKLQEIYRLRTLQDKVLLFRSSNEVINGNNIKQTLKKDLQNLINAEITIVQTEIKLPDPNAIPPFNLENLDPDTRAVNLEKILIDEKMTMEALEMLK